MLTTVAQHDTIHASGFSYIGHLIWTGVQALSTHLSALSTRHSALRTLIILNTHQSPSSLETRHLTITPSSHPISSMSYTFDRVAPGSLVLVTGERGYYKTNPPHPLESTVVQTILTHVNRCHRSHRIVSHAESLICLTAQGH
jgi:hypothetical protein